MATLNINSDNVIELRGLKNVITDLVITSATVTVTLKTSAGVEVTGATWPLTMSHVTNGLYRTILPNELSLNSSLAYVATIIADNGADQHKEWCVPYSATCA